MLQPLKVDLGSAQQDNYLQHILTPLEGGRLRVPFFFGWGRECWCGDITCRFHAVGLSDYVSSTLNMSYWPFDANISNIYSKYKHWTTQSKESL